MCGPRTGTWDPFSDLWGGPFGVRGRGEVSVDITLSDAEVDVLREMMQKDIHQLVMEIAKADHREFRDELKAKEAALEAILVKLSPC